MVFIKNHQIWLTGKFPTTWRHQMEQSSANCWLLEGSQIKWIRWNLFAQPEGIWKHLGDGYEHMLYNIRTYHDNEIDERRELPHWQKPSTLWAPPLGCSAPFVQFQKNLVDDDERVGIRWHYSILFYFTQSTMYDIYIYIYLYIVIIYVYIHTYWTL